jgi:hypothetical protein
MVLLKKPHFNIFWPHPYEVRLSFSDEIFIFSNHLAQISDVTNAEVKKAFRSFNFPSAVSASLNTRPLRERYSTFIWFYGVV